MENPDAFAATEKLQEEVTRSTRDKRSLYESLGPDVLDWALRQAQDDAAESVRKFKYFLQISGLPSKFDVASLLLYWEQLWFSGLFVPFGQIRDILPSCFYVGSGRGRWDTLL
jgi:hypothetical protein